MSVRNLNITVTAVDKVSKTFQSIDKRINSMGKSLQKAGKQMQDTGKTLSTRVTAPLVGLGTAAVMTVAKFDDSMSKVQAVSGATGEDLESMRDLAQDLGSTTAHSASQAADAMGYLALAGWETNEIMEATPQMLSLASAGSLDLAQAADIVSDTMSGFGMAAEDAGRAADVFAAAQAGSNVSVEMLGESMKYAAPIANMFGASLEETSAVAGMMGDAGIKASQAGTALRSGFRRLAGPTEDGAAALESMGVATVEADGSMRGIVDIMQDMEAGMDGMSQEAKIAAATQKFGAEASGAWMAVMEGGTDNLQAFTEELYDSKGAADDMAETMEDNIGGAFRAMRSQMEGILIQLGDLLVPVLMNHVVPALEAMSEWISNAIDWFTQLDPQWQKVIGLAVGFAAALGPMLLIAGKVVAAVGTMTVGIAALSSPIVIVIAAVAAFAAGLIHLYRTNDEFREKVTGAWERIKAFGLETWALLKETTKSVFESVEKTVKHTLEWIAGFWDTWGSTIMGVVEIVWGQIELIITTAIKVVQGVIQTVLAVIRGDWKKAWEGIRSIFSNIWGLITGTIKNMAKVIGTVLSGLAKNAIVWARDMVVEFILGIDQRLKDIGSKAQEIYGEIKSKIDDLITDMKVWAINAVKSFISGITEWIGNVRAKAEELAGSVIGGIKGVFGMSSPSTVMIDIGEEVCKSMETGIENEEDAPKTKLEDVGDWLIEHAEGIASGMIEPGENICKSLGDGIEQLSELPKSKLEEVGKALTTQAGSIAEAITSALSNFRVPDLSAIVADPSSYKGLTQSDIAHGDYIGRRGGNVGAATQSEFESAVKAAGVEFAKKHDVTTSVGEDMARAAIREGQHHLVENDTTKKATGSASDSSGSSGRESGTSSTGATFRDMRATKDKNWMGTDYWKGGPTWVGEKGPEIVDLPKGARITPNHEIDSAFDPLPRKMGQTGEALLRSLSDGMKDRKKRLESTAKNVAGDLLRSFKGVLGMKSPSAVMVDAGEEICNSLGKGIEDQSEVPKAKLAAVGEGLKSQAEGIANDVTSTLSGAASDARGSGTHPSGMSGLGYMRKQQKMIDEMDWGADIPRLPHMVDTAGGRQKEHWTEGLRAGDFTARDHVDMTQEMRTEYRKRGPRFLEALRRAGLVTGRDVTTGRISGAAATPDEWEKWMKEEGEKLPEIDRRDWRTPDFYYKDGVPTQYKHKHGGVIPGNWQGTDYWGGGLTWVGEKGPEILDLPRGSRVTANHDIKGGGDFKPTININVSGGDGDSTAKKVKEAVKRQVVPELERYFRRHVKVGVN